MTKNFDARFLTSDYYEPYFMVEFDAVHKGLAESIFKLIQGEAEAALSLGKYEDAQALIGMLKKFEDAMKKAGETVEEVPQEVVELDCAG